MSEAVGTIEAPSTWSAPRGTRRRAPRKFAKHALHPRRVLAGAMAAGVAFDLALQQQTVGVATTLWCVIVLASVAWLGSERRRASLVAFGAAATFTPWFIVRSSPWLLIPNTVAFVALVGYGADLAAGGPVRRSVSGLARVAVSAVEAAVESFRFLGRTSVRAGEGLGTKRSVPWRGVARSITITAPVIAVLFVLLVSGDALFASTFEGLASLGFDHVAIVVCGAWLFGVLATMASSPSRAPVAQRQRQLPGLDALALLGGVAVLFFVYACVQLSGLLSGAQYVQDRTGLTYAQYARSGFFQLMAAAAISFVVLCVVRPTVQQATVGGKALRWLVAAVVVLTNGLVVGSIIRIQLYSDVFGLTHLRLYTVVSAVWLGVVVLLAGIAAIRRGSGNWMAVTASAVAAVAVLTMNVVNPDLVVARENISRADTSAARFDSPYLASLSADATPWIIDHLDEVPADDREDLVAALCAQDQQAPDGWAGWNAAHASAAHALRALCG